MARLIAGRVPWLCAPDEEAEPPKAVQVEPPKERLPTFRELFRESPAQGTPNRPSPIGYTHADAREYVRSRLRRKFN